MDNHEEGELWEVKLPDQSHTAGSGTTRDGSLKPQVQKVAKYFILMRFHL